MEGGRQDVRHDLDVEIRMSAHSPGRASHAEEARPNMEGGRPGCAVAGCGGGGGGGGGGCGGGAPSEHTSPGGSRAGGGGHAPSRYSYGQPSYAEQAYFGDAGRASPPGGCYGQLSTSPPAAQPLHGAPHAGALQRAPLGLNHGLGYVGYSSVIRPIVTERADL
eukprot:5250674-Prymnesium_polylepis.1